MVTVLSVLTAAGLTLAGWLAAQLARARAALIAARHEATHDRLTGLANRAGLAETWPRYATEAARAVLLIDLDRFKPINDRHGHAAGDRVLTVIAGRLRHLTPGVVARLGGDEFAALVAHPDPARLADRLTRAVSAPVALPGGTTVAVSVSIGVVVDPGPDLASVLACADAAMYRAKTTRTGAAIYHPHLDDRPSLASHPRPAGRVRDLPTQAPAWEVAA